jgi:sarcosine oxidase
MFLASVPAARDAPLLETRACHYELSISRNFIIDRLPGRDNVWIAGAGNAEGFKTGTRRRRVHCRTACSAAPPTRTLDALFRVPDDEYPPA